MMKLRSYSPPSVDPLPCNADDYVFLSDNVKYWFGQVRDIIMMTANENYVEVITSTGQLSIRHKLNVFEAKLPPGLFFRATRGCIINLAHVKKMTMADPKRFMLVLDNGAEIVLSRLQTVAFRRSKCL